MASAARRLSLYRHPDLYGQVVFGEGLLDKIHPLFKYAPVSDDVGRITGHEQAPEIWVAGFQ
jgi:hypothetical protein